MNIQKRLLGINVLANSAEPDEKLISYIRRAGFDACFTGWSEDAFVMDARADAVAREGLIYQSIHAPFHKVSRLWEDEGEEGEAYLSMLLSCLRDCKRLDVPIMVTHAFIGFEKHEPTDFGLKRFEKVVAEAEKLLDNIIIV